MKVTILWFSSVFFCLIFLMPKGMKGMGVMDKITLKENEKIIFFE